MFTRICSRSTFAPIQAWRSLQSVTRSMATTSTSTSEQRVDHAGRGARETRTWMRLHNVPRTALHNDVRRAVSRAGVDVPFDVHLDYYRFLRNDYAFLKFETGQDMYSALLRIGGRNKFQITSRDILCIPSNAPDGMPARFRGFRGRAIAAQKGLVSGTGPDAGTYSKGKDVVLWGLPGRIDTEEILAALDGYALRKREETKLQEGTEEEGLDAEEREQVIIKLPQVGRALTSRVLVRLDNISEAHRLVRTIHMTYWDEALWGPKYMCHARVVY